MSFQQKQTHDEWIRKRWHTTIIFAVQTVIIGMDVHIAYVSLLLYVHEVSQVAASRAILYGAASNAYLLAVVIFSPFIGAIVDRTRRIRKAFFACNSMAIIGHILYTMNFSPFLLVGGRYLAGVGMCLRGVINGEICRSYTTEETPKIFCFLGAAIAFGYFMCSTMNAIFADVGFHVVGKWRISSANFSGVYMAVLYGILHLLTLFFVSDLARIYDLKEETTESTAFLSTVQVSAHEILGGTESSLHSGDNDYNGDNDDIDDIDDDDVEDDAAVRTSSSCTVIMTSFKTYDTCFVIVLGFVGYYGFSLMEASIGMLVVERRGWDKYWLDLITGGLAAMCVVVCLLSAFIKLTPRHIYYILFSWPICLCVVQLIELQQFYCAPNKAVDIIVWTVFCLCFGVMALSSELAAQTLGAMVASPVQNFTEGVRYALLRLGASFALFISSFVFPYMGIAGPMYIVVLFVTIFVAYTRRQSLKDPRVIVFT